MISRLPWRIGLLLATLFPIVACRADVSKEEARRLIERYNQTVSEAYRRCDVKLIDAVVAPEAIDGKRLTGLIGVRMDMGISLDAKLLSLEISGVKQTGDELRISTRERWNYREYKIGTGLQCGEESSDSYEMLYILRYLDGKWMVCETQFTSPPTVGREATPWGADPGVLHGIGDNTPTKGKTAP